MCFCVCSHVPLFDFELRLSFATPALLVILIDFPPSFLLIQLVPLPLFKHCLFCVLYQFVAQFLMRSSACASLPVSWILPVPLCLFLDSVFYGSFVSYIFTFLTGSSVISPLDIFSFCTMFVLLTFCFESAIKILFDCIRSAFGSLSANPNITN